MKIRTQNMNVHVWAHKHNIYEYWNLVRVACHARLSISTLMSDHHVLPR